ncbi:unnamed protein product [Parascedosporium putredinis]|uniref:Uncharacterized protein n=1 Tax=Parascedosporium putredinis TaxID=1442378 RepID=A0A9P1H8W9_9PEZI|nr:unnamed protein product [Parascedosporium putredinis]CAI8000239.1 unnamed protein product [Parascedosporium putredinis]
MRDVDKAKGGCVRTAPLAPVSANPGNLFRADFHHPLTYPDISLGAKDIERIGYGGDVWEVRVDLLSDAQHPLGATNLPSYEYVRQQVRKFPDDAVNEALALMLLAVELNCLYIDVEIEWPQQAIDALVAAKGASKLVASFHSWTGDIRWTKLYIAGSDESGVQFAVQAHRLGLDELGLPHRVSVVDRTSIERTVKGPAFGGAAAFDDLASDLSDFVDEISDSATKSGLVDTVHCSTDSSEDTVLNHQSFAAGNMHGLGKLQDG